MQQNEALIASAFTDFRKLKSIHQRFIEEIEKYAAEQAPVASLTVNGGILSASYLDMIFVAAHRTVAIECQLVANEYAFLGTLLNGQEYTLFCFYLTADGGLYLDSARNSRLCDFNNQYVAKNVLAKIQIAALSSPSFAPRM